MFIRSPYDQRWFHNISSQQVVMVLLDHLREYVFLLYLRTQEYRCTTVAIVLHAREVLRLMMINYYIIDWNQSTWKIPSIYEDVAMPLG